MALRCRRILAFCSLSIFLGGIPLTAAVVEPGPSDPDAPKEFTATRSGLKYRILRKAKGDKPAAEDSVTVHYRGWLPNNGDKEFDSSYRRGEPITFGLNQVIPGWTEGMQLVGTGGMIELEVPPELGYGAQGTPGGPIPPNATLRFLVELKSVKKAPPAVTPGKVDADAPKEFSKTATGLKYRILRKSDGAKPKATQTVTVHYEGWLPGKDEASKTVFDSSYKRREPTTFPLNRVIPGWTEGLQLIGSGGMIELEIPPELGYGAQGTPGGPIPPNATLRFLVELIEIEQ